MLTMMEVKSQSGRILSLPLDDYSSGYLVVDIDGLDPVNASIVTSQYGRLDGTRYQGAHRDNRNIVITLKYESAYARKTVSELREKLYDFFMPKSQVELTFHVGGVPFLITGHVEDFTSPKFVSDPKATISIICVDPDFYAMNSVVVEGTSVSDATEFDLSYPGSVETGVIFTLRANRDVREFQLINETPTGLIHTFDFYAPIGPLPSGANLVVSSISGSKYARIVHSPLVQSFMYAVAPTSHWIQLYKGINKIRVQIDGAAVPYSIEYRAKYGAL